MSWRLCRGRRLGLALLAVLACAAAGGAEERPAGRRIVAIGDIHGAHNGVRAILREAGIIDQRDRWAGGDTVFVQTGDFLDRGPSATEVARLLMSLQQQAGEDGGEVVVLLGNHEAMNLLGDRRDVSHHNYKLFVDQQSETRQTVICNEHAKLRRRQARERREPVPKNRELVAACLEEQPLGFAEYVDELGPEGRIGQWLRGLPVAVAIEGIVFVHGGISPEMAPRGLEDLNQVVHEEIAAFDRARAKLLKKKLILETSSLREVLGATRQLARREVLERAQSLGIDPGSASAQSYVPKDLRPLLDIREWLMIYPDGPLWFRGYGHWSEEEGTAQMPAILETLGAEHVVVAHTPQQGYRIANRFEDRVYLIDTGMLTSYYKGRPSALEIVDGRFTAIYLEREEILEAPLPDDAPETTAGVEQGTQGVRQVLKE